MPVALRDHLWECHVIGQHLQLCVLTGDRMM